MSDTDDTDVLLLIPPDFFVVNADSEESYYEKSHEHYEPHCGIVNNLISQVHKIENRLQRIEVNSEVSHCNSVNSSCNSTIIPFYEMSGGNHHKNEYKYYPNEGNYVSSSSKSTPQKPKFKMTGHSLPSTPSVTDKPSSYKHRRPQQFSRFTSQNMPKGFVQQIAHNQSTDADESSFNTTPEKYQNKRILGEIDHFLTNVKTIQNLSAQKNLTPAFNADNSNKRETIRFDEPTITLSDLKIGGDTKKINRLNLKDVNRLLQTMETQQQMMESRDRSMECLYENENFVQSKQTWQCGDSQESVPDLGYGMRNIMYNRENQQKRIEEPIQKTIVPNSELIPDPPSKPESLNASDSSPPTVLERVSNYPNFLNARTLSEPTTNTEKVIANIRHAVPQNETDHIGSVQQFSSETLTEYNKTEHVNPLYTKIKLPVNLDVSNNQISFNTQPPPGNTSNINLFSLAGLWNENGTNNLMISDKEMKKLLPKLEEEKCRRKHCEKLIQELQMKILEMQQRLAVACQVDSAKDEAILRFHEAWEKVAHRWQSLEAERNSLSKKLYVIEEKANIDVTDATQKVAQCEVELSKALDLAHNNQDKCNKLELERSALLSQLSDLRTEVKTTQDTLQEIAIERDKLAEKMSHLEKESVKAKQILLQTQNEISHSKNVFQTCQNELSGLREEHFKLQKRIKEEQGVNVQLESQKKNLQHSLDSAKKTESALHLEFRNLQEESERTKLDLRNFYQQQVEVLVKDKLKEFQDQLEQAEKSLQDELQSREQVIARSAAKQLQKLTDKHRLEVQLIEEKHKEEVRLYELQFAHMKEQISLLQGKLESYHAKRANIAQELHTVMETQWREALRIINNGKNSTPGTPQSIELSKQVSEENNKQFSMQDLKKILAKQELLVKEAVGTTEREKVDNHSTNFRAAYFPKEQTPIEMNNELFRNLGIYDTPVSSKPTVQMEPNNEAELKKYIKLLLEKTARQSTEKPLESIKMPNSQDSSSSDMAEVSSWQHLSVPKLDDRCSAVPGKEYRSGKPPWK